MSFPSPRFYIPRLSSHPPVDIGGDGSKLQSHPASSIQHPASSIAAVQDTGGSVGGQRQETAAAAESSGSVRGQGQRSGAVTAWPPPGRSKGRDSCRVGRDRSNHWRIAYASAKEVDSHLKLLVHAGAINRTATPYAMNAFDEVRAMTWRLHNPKS